MRILLCSLLLVLSTVLGDVCLSGQNKYGSVCFGAMISDGSRVGSICANLVTSNGAHCVDNPKLPCTGFEISTQIDASSGWQLSKSLIAFSNSPNKPVSYSYNCTPASDDPYRRSCKVIIPFKNVYGNGSEKNLCNSLLRLSTYSNLVYYNDPGTTSTAWIQGNVQLLTGECDGACSVLPPEVCYDVFGFADGISECFRDVYPSLSDIGFTVGPISPDVGEYGFGMFGGNTDCQVAYREGDVFLTMTSGQVLGQPSQLDLMIAVLPDYYMKNSSIFIGNSAYKVPIVGGVPTVNPSQYTFTRTYGPPYPATDQYNVLTESVGDFYAIIYAQVCTR